MAALAWRGIASFPLHGETTESPSRASRPSPREYRLALPADGPKRVPI